jgi:hypothetical protein
MGSERVATLVGARTLTTLEAAGQELLDSGAVTATADRSSFYFRGRALIVPEVAIFVGDQAEFVPVGTTVRQLYERYAGMAGAGVGGLDSSAFAGARRPRRLIHEGMANTPAYRYLVFDTYRRFGNVDLYDLPVVQGDRFVL